jgi:hypothetical protein
MRSARQLKKLIFRMDGAADSRKVEFRSQAGRRWEAEFCLHAGTDPQAARLKILFRCLSDPREPQRYTEAPPGVSRSPAEAVRQVGEADLWELLANSVKV